MKTVKRSVLNTLVKGDVQVRNKNSGNRIRVRLGRRGLNM